jgi:hypothetical protein
MDTPARNTVKPDTVQVIGDDRIQVDAVSIPIALAKDEVFGM